MALGAIGKDNERKRENEKIRGSERMRESRSEGKKEGRDVFVKRQERGVVKNMNR